jgi:hypothetical protein
MPTIDEAQNTVILTLPSMFTFPEWIFFVAGAIPDDVIELFQFT